ncbi:MAG: DEAD/DEAH box helicase [Selenomonadaceae bacterium]|nr:DEAD/DEAH box helicase [Selenomonadaceae bacterium]MBQ7628747.1 DEAD/DEAH box helicase [Selenomonadaceae bacterium]
MTKAPKRIIWAYDELQSLNSLDMPSLEELFGTDDSGNALITLRNEPGKPRQDLNLYVCYRNPLWSLTVAHALGFGVYRDAGLIQMFESPDSWENVGYLVENGDLDYGKQVTLKRSKDSMPQYFNELLTPSECLEVKKFDTVADQYKWVTEQIYKNIHSDKLLPEDICVVLLSSPDDGSFPYKAYDELSGYFLKKRIHSVSPKERDVFKKTGYITCSQIFRAKGNEAPMVYVINADTCAGGNAAMRNRLFTAITRSKAWVRITGTGNAMDDIVKEIERCVENDYCLQFKFPIDEQLQNIRRIHIDDIDERLKHMFESISNGEFSMDKLLELAELLSKQGDRKKLQQKTRSAYRKGIIHLTAEDLVNVDKIYIPRKKK